jgi:hypothetical protein
MDKGTIVGLPTIANDIFAEKSFFFLGEESVKIRRLHDENQY